MHWQRIILLLNLQKKESGNIVYLVCTKRGNKSNKYPGKAKHKKKEGKLIIYSKSINNNNHNGLTFDEFNELYDTDQKQKLNLNVKLYQKYFIQKKLLITIHYQ